MRLLERKRRKVTITITSLIDVVLLLLIFFMLTTSFVEKSGMKLDLPATETASGEKSDKLEISISTDGNMFLNKQPVNVDNLEDDLHKLIRENKFTSLLLRADKSVPHGTVVKVMDIARICGLEKIIIASKAEPKNNIRK